MACYCGSGSEFISSKKEEKINEKFLKMTVSIFGVVEVLIYSAATEEEDRQDSIISRPKKHKKSLQQSNEAHQ